MNQQPKVEQKPKVRRWLWITLLVVIVAAGLSVWTYLLPSTEITTTSPSAKATDDLAQVDNDLNKMESDLNQLDNINAAEDNLPAL